VKIRTVSETARQGYIKDIVVAGYQQGRGMLHSYPVNIVGWRKIQMFFKTPADMFIRIVGVAFERIDPLQKIFLFLKL